MNVSIPHRPRHSPAAWYSGIARSVRIAAILLAAATPLLAEDDDRWDVLGEEVDGVPVHRLLADYQLRQLRPHFAARRAAVDAIDTVEQFEARRDEIRRRLFRANGPFPERTPLEPQVLGKIERDGYVIEKVIYESRPSHHVTANLYLPTDVDEPVPGVLVPCGHSANGKAAGVYQSVCISLAKRGMAALIYDPIGQGERHQILDENGKPAARGTTEHTLLGVGGWLVGTGTHNYRIWDGIRSLDYLASRREVDADRLGCTGNSGGGTLTSYLMAFDPRIDAAAPSCYLTTLERLFDTIGPQDAEQNFPGQVALGLDHADFIHLRAPKPTLMCVATQDFFDIDGAWTTFREAKRLYALLGHSERIDIIEYDDKHGFSAPRRTAAMRFLRRWLLDKDDNPDEGELTLSSDEELQCTRTGEVLRDFEDGVSVGELTRRRAESLASSREAAWRDSSDRAIERVRELTGFRPVGEPPSVSSKGSVAVDEGEYDWKGTIEKLVLERNGEVPVPALLYRPELPPDARARAVIHASSEGKSSSAEPGGACARLAAAGKIVLSVDVRGVGETRASRSRDRGGFFGSDFKTALLAIHLDRPLLGQRVEDLQAALEYVLSRDDVAADGVELVGVGRCGPVALHLAAFDRRIGGVRLVRCVESWLEVASAPLTVDQLTNVVPFALEHYDLPDLVAAIEPRAVVFESPVDPRGRLEGSEGRP